MTFDLDRLTGTQLVVLVLGVAAVFGFFLAVTLIAALRAAVFPPPVALLVILTSVTLAMVAVYLLTRDRELLTLAGMGLGALSGAVAATWSRKDH